MAWINDVFMSFFLPVMFYPSPGGKMMWESAAEKGGSRRRRPFEDTVEDPVVTDANEVPILHPPTYDMLIQSSDGACHSPLHLSAGYLRLFFSSFSSIQDARSRPSVLQRLRM